MLHREGTKTIFVSLLILALPYVLLTQLGAPEWAVSAYLAVGLVLLGLVLQFFRNPTRTTVAQAGDVIAPADGTVVELDAAKLARVLDGPAPAELLASLEAAWLAALRAVLASGRTHAYATH